MKFYISICTHSDEDFENVSTYSGTYKEGQQEDDDEKSEDEDDIIEAERDFESTLIKNSSLYSSVSTAQTLKSNVSSENHEEPLSQHETKSNAPTVGSSISPREVPPVTLNDRGASLDALRLREIEEKFHYVRMENEQLKINLETTQEAAQQAESKLFEIQLKMQMVQSKADKEIKQVEEKIKEAEKQYKTKEQDMIHQHETETERLKSEMERVKNEMTKRNNDLQNEKDKLEKNLKAEIDRLNLELKQANERFSSNMSSSQSSFQQEIQKLKTEISELNKKKEAEQIELQKQISEINSQKSLIEAKKLELEKNLSEVTKKFLQLENEYKDRQQEIHNLSQKLEKEIKEKENITNTLNNEKKLLNIEIEELKVKFSETEMKGSLQSSENSKLLETLKNERETLNSKLTSLQQDLQKTEIQKSDLTFQLKKSEETLQDKEDEIKKLKSELEKAKNEGSASLESANTKINHLNIDLENLKKQEEQLSQSISQLNSQIVQFKNDVAEKDRLIQEINQRLQNQENQISQLKQEISELNQTIHNLENALAEKENALSQEIEKSKETNSKLTSALVSIKNLENEIEEKCERIEELENQISQLKESSTSTGKELQDQLNEKDEKILELQNEISKFKSLKKKIEEKLKNLEQENQTLQDENNELNHLIEQCSKRIEDKDKQMKKLEESHKKALENAENKISQERLVVERELEKTKIELIANQYSHLEHFILDRTVLNSQTNDFLVLDNLSKIYFKNIVVKEFLSEIYPTPAKILLKCILQWNPEEVKTATLDSKIILGKTFGINLLISLNYLLERFKTTRNKPNNFSAGANESGELENSTCLILFWIHTLYRLIHDLELKRKTNFSPIFEQVTQKLIKIEPALLIGEDVPTSKFVSMPYLVNYYDCEKVTNESLIVTSIDSLVMRLSEILVQMYAEFFRHVIIRLRPYLIKAIFNSKLTTSKSTDGGLDTRLLQQFLNRIFDTFKQLRIEPRITQHFFSNLAKLSDAVIFNHFLVKETIGANVALTVKMGLVFLENWFHSKNIADIELIQQLISFHYSRELSDVCILGQKQVLSDDSLRSAVCPHISKHHLVYIFNHLTLDSEFKLTNDSSTTTVIPETSQSPTSSNGRSPTPNSSLGLSHSSSVDNLETSSQPQTPKRNPLQISLSSSQILTGGTSPSSARRTSFKGTLLASSLDLEKRLEGIIVVPEIELFKYAERESYGVDPSSFYGVLGPLSSMMIRSSSSKSNLDKDSPRYKLNKELENVQQQKEHSFTLAENKFLFYFSGVPETQASTNFILEEWLFSVISNYGGKREAGVEGIVKIPRERIFSQCVNVFQTNPPTLVVSNQEQGTPTSARKGNSSVPPQKKKTFNFEDELAFLFE